LKSGRNSAAEYRLVDREDLGGISLEQRADPDFFYRNEGAGRFVREPIAGNPRIVDEQGRMLAEEPEDFGLAVIFADLDGDGAPDLYVANDFEDPDQFWLNDGRGNFRLAPWFAMRSSSNSTMAVDVGDVDRDGRPDLFQVDMLSQDTRRRRDLVKLMGRWGCGSASAYATEARTAGSQPSRPRRWVPNGRGAQRSCGRWCRPSGGNVGGFGVRVQKRR
jgi:hypothetical protein